MTAEEVKRLVSILEKIVDTKIQKYALRENHLSPIAFEEKNMTHYTHGMYVDHILFRKFLHEVDLAKDSLKFLETLDERPDVTTADTESLYFVLEDGSLSYIEDGEYKIVNLAKEELFSQWLIDNNDFLLALLEEEPINPEIKFLNGLRQWVEIAIGGAGYEAPIYYTGTDSATHIIGSDTLFYKKISYQPDASETPIQVTSKDNARTLVGTFLYDAQIATTTIDSGNFGFKLKCKVNNSQGINVLEYVPFLYHIDGTRTDLFTCVSDPIINTTFVDNFKQYPSGTIHCLSTDRLGVDVYFKSNSASLKTLDSLIGDGYASYMVTPLRLRHDGLRDLDGNELFLHSTRAEKNDYAIKAYKAKVINIIGGKVSLESSTHCVLGGVTTSSTPFTIELPTIKAGYTNEEVFTFKVGGTIPNIIYPTIAKWRTDPIELSINSTRTIVFERISFDGLTYETFASCDIN